MKTLEKLSKLYAELITLIKSNWRGETAEETTKKILYVVKNLRATSL